MPRGSYKNEIQDNSLGHNEESKLTEYLPKFPPPEEVTFKYQRHLIFSFLFHPVANLYENSISWVISSGSQRWCAFDWLYIDYVGNHHDIECGYAKVPKPRLVEGKRGPATITFHSDDLGNGKGFEIQIIKLGGKVWF